MKKSSSKGKKAVVFVLCVVLGLVLLHCITSVVDFENPLFAVVVDIGIILCFFCVWPKLEERKRFEKNKNEILGVIDGLDLANDDFFSSEVRSTALRNLERSRTVPDTEFVFEYEAQNGWIYHANPSDSKLFAVICVLLYAQSIEKTDLVERYEAMLNKAGRWGPG